MISTTFDSIWRDISPFAVGFDRTFDTLELLANSKAKEANYPPYNIRKLSDDQYTIELAIAGFNEKDIDVELTGENLVIKGNRPKEATDGLLHQGLATRDFIKRFILSEDMIIKGAALSNGMLYVGVERVIPEEKKSRKIKLTSKAKLLG
ncbi:MAG: heat-shock protein [Gammaproteobacteria bacterium]|uniref:SHSP domain-containing protein n=1 Tax=marine metagenome TaxID=408172 RepID=A0A381QPL1_9ZZZZ|nr:heat-shock protein [Gammaproteobacteria bacterium]|tara:strand:- start:639 stop:1088 length:450 start_codon:yes stop_codon:yes gene_type:complete